MIVTHPHYVYIALIVMVVGFCLALLIPRKIFFKRNSKQADIIVLRIFPFLSIISITSVGLFRIQMPPPELYQGYPLYIIIIGYLVAGFLWGCIVKYKASVEKK